MPLESGIWRIDKAIKEKGIWDDRNTVCKPVTKNGIIPWID